MILLERYLEEDPSTTVLERRRQLVGYEVYIVEQWACSRVDPTFVITTFTGLPQHTVVVGVLSVPTDETAWSPRLRVYLKAISKFHARRKETALGILMVTNLSGFPSALTVILVPGGDVRSHRESFIVNEDLKRLGCSGRAGMNLGLPVGATQAKFDQLYRTSDRVILPHAVIELVKLCQVALVVFTKLASEYADGLLCDITERAINDWWTEIGIEYFNVEPSDGILGPTTVAALLGMLLGARNRLNAYGAPVGKDVFDLKATKRGIAYFQKSQKLPKTRRLDRQTLNRLHRATSKAANSEGWAVPRAVKSTVAELGGKGGEMVMGMVGARDKAGISEVETLDIATFIHAVSGERCKWLWHGKPPKNHSAEFFNTLAGEDEMVFSGDEAGGYVWSSRKRDSVTEQGPTGAGSLDHLYLQLSEGSQNSFEPFEKDQAFRKNMFKSVTDKMSDARSGLGRFKDAVGIPGLRGHHHKTSKDEGFVPISERSKHLGARDSQGQTDLDIPSISSKNSPSHRLTDQNLAKSTKPALVDSIAGTQNTNESARYNGSCVTQQVSNAYLDADLVLSPRVLDGVTDQASVPDHPPLSRSESPGHNLRGKQSGVHSDTLAIAPAMVVKSARLPRFLKNSMSLSLQSSRSLTYSPYTITARHDYTVRLPRYLSFSVMDGVLVSENKASSETPNKKEAEDKVVEVLMSDETYLIHQVSSIDAQLHQLEERDVSWIREIVSMVEDLNRSTTKDQDDLDTIYHQRLEEQNSLQVAITDLVSEEKISVTEALKDIDVLAAKLEYELGAMRSKVQDVEDGVLELARQVYELEAKAQNLEDGEKHKDSWLISLLGILLWKPY